MPYLGINNQVGVREELADYVAFVDAKSTPFVSMAPKGKDLGNVIMSWQVDNYSAPQLGGVVDGTDVSSYVNVAANRTRLTNYAQAFRRNARTGFIADTSNVAGVQSEVANSISKMLVEIKRDMESTFLCTNQAAQQDNGSTNAYQTGSLGNWLLSTNSSNIGALASGSQFAPAGGVTPGTTASNAISSVTSANFVEATAQNVLTAIYGATGTFREYDCILGTTLKRAFTNLTAGGSNVQVANTNSIAATGVRTFNQELASDTFKSSIDLFEGDFGILRLHPTTFLGGKNAAALSSEAYRGYVIPMDMVEIRYAKLPEVKDLPDAGGGPVRLVQAIAGLVVKNPNGFGMFAGAS